MNWGLIGASTIASQYMIEAIRAQDGHEIKTVQSASAAHGAQFAKAHNIPKATDDLSTLLADADIAAVYISSTNEKHKDQALAAIAAGKHVLCEKPLAMTVEDAVEMVKAAERAGLVFATNHHLRNAGSHIKIRQLISDGEIGSVQSIRIFHAVYLPENLQGWRINDAGAGGGVIPDIVVHDADTVRFYLQQDPERVVALERSESMGKGVEDNVMSIWTMPSGVMVQTHESFTHRFAKTGVEIYGTKGSIIAREVMTQRPVGEIFLTNEDGTREVAFDDHNLYAHSLGLFARAVNGEGRPSADGMDGIKSLAVALAVKKSAVTGCTVNVDYGNI
jgi:1,5-anhydro-D-fructose reductase (1,5-anhydro-D-mannitol-forming)